MRISRTARELLQGFTASAPSARAFASHAHYNFGASNAFLARYKSITCTGVISDSNDKQRSTVQSNLSLRITYFLTVEMMESNCMPVHCIK